MTIAPKISSDAIAARLQKTFGHNVRVARQELGLSQRDLAAAVNIPQRRIVLIETAAANPTIKTMARLSKCLDKSVVDLLTTPTRIPRT